MGKRKQHIMSESKKNVITRLIKEYDIKTAEENQAALTTMLMFT
jgi:hypothetical protein